MEMNNQITNSIKKFVIANWKMHGNLKQNQDLLQAYASQLTHLKNTKVVVCVPYPYLSQAQQVLQDSHISWGAQNIAKNV